MQWILWVLEVGGENQWPMELAEKYYLLMPVLGSVTESIIKENIRHISRVVIVMKKIHTPDPRLCFLIRR